MPLGTEPYVAQWLKAIQNDEGLKGLFAVDGSSTDVKVRAYRDKVPPRITYPFFFVGEATESQDLRDSETVGGIAPKHVEFQVVHLIAYGAGGDLPWKMIERVRQMSIDDVVKSPYLRADPTNDSENVFDIRVLTASKQTLSETMFKDEKANDVNMSTQSFLLYGRKKGGV